MSRRRETSTDRREVQVLLRWQVLIILNQVMEERADACVWRRRRLFGLSLLILRNLLR